MLDFNNAVMKTVDIATHNDETIVSLPKDPLVLSCVIYRLSKDKPEDRGLSINYNSTMLAENVTSADIALSEVIKSDFRKKLSYFALTVGKLSKFKTDLYSFLETDFKQLDGTYKVPDKYLAMAYKLPYFYEYNMKQQALFDTETRSVPYDVFTGKVSLTFLRTLDPKTKKSKGTIEYWFEDENKNRVSVEINKSNPLLPMLDNYIRTNTIEIDGTFRKRSNYAVQYYVVEKWEVNV